MEIFQTPVRISATGGVERYVHDLSAELVSRGHKITVVCSTDLHTRQDDRPYTIIPLTPFFKIANTDITPLLLPTLLCSRFDLIHTQIPTPWSADVSMVATWIKRKPLVVTYQNDIMASGPTSFIAGLYNRIFLPLVLKKAGRIIITRTHYPSPFLRKFSQKLVHIPPGVNTEQFKPGDYPKIGDIFFLSVLDEYHQYKGIETLFLALQYLKPRFPGILVVIGGSGELKEFYQKKAVEMGIASNILFAGYIPEKDLPRYYGGTSVFILPSTDSTREGFGLVLLEAMACGRPVITTDIAGMAEDIKEFGSGMIIPRESPESLAEGIARCMEHPDETEAMGRSARILIEQKYDWKVIAEKIETVYSHLLTERNNSLHSNRGI